MVDVFSHKVLVSCCDGGKEFFSHYVGDAIILSAFTIFFCMVGLAGNGNIIWLLGFHIKRKPFAIYILNLAVADFGTLAFLVSLNIYYYSIYFHSYEPPYVVFVFLLGFFISMYYSSQLLLTAISIDRWASVLFPNCYPCHRSLVSSTTMCALMWALSFVLGGVPLIQELTLLIPGDAATTFALEYNVSTLTCPLIVTISTLTLSIKACLKPCPQRNLLKVALLLLFPFLLFTILTNICLFMTPFQFSSFSLWTSLKSSINPLIYFLAGRQNGGKFQERMKIVFQRVFKEQERDNRMGLQPHIQTML